MINRIFNRTIFLWAIAILVAVFIVDPQLALLQRVNNMNEAYIDCLRQENCADTRAISEAREYYMILDELYPNYGRGAEMQGLCYLLLGQKGLAIKKFQAAIRHNPRLFWVSFELGKALYREGKYTEALKCFQGIDIKDSNTLLDEATLSALHRMPDRTREVLMLTLIDFVNEIRLKSYQMTIGCFVHQGDLTRARGITNFALNDQQLGRNRFFVMANISMGQDASIKEMLSWIDAIARAKPVSHPWGHLIQPLKEILY